MGARVRRDGTVQRACQMHVPLFGAPGQTELAPKIPSAERAGVVPSRTGEEDQVKMGFGEGTILYLFLKTYKKIMNLLYNNIIQYL